MFQDCLCEIYTKYIEDRKIMNETDSLDGVENIIARLLSTEVLIFLHVDGR